MILVLTYVDTDNCTYWVTVALPFKAESSEQALVDLEKLIVDTNERAKNTYNNEFVFHGLKLSTDSFYAHSYESQTEVLTLPNILTIEEWYNAENGAV